MKIALCIQTSDFVSQFGQFQPNKVAVYPIPDGFFGLPTQLIDREICETDGATKQLIPYTVVKTPDGRVFQYVRGNKTEEARLALAASIGVGGHVEEAPMLGSLYSLLQREAAREIEEEIGVVVNPRDIAFVGLIYDSITDVGAVHLGILCQCVLPDGTFSAEEGTIEEGTFLLPEQLAVDRLEGWSLAAVNSGIAGSSSFTAVLNYHSLIPESLAPDPV